MHDNFPTLQICYYRQKYEGIFKRILRRASNDTQRIVSETTLYAFRYLKEAYIGNHVLCINVDASSWNNRFSNHTVTPIMKETVSKVFENRLFNMIHTTYQNTLVYVPDEVDTYFWDGQDGGTEGHHQDTWVWVYLSMIHSILDPYQFEYKLLCKCDDLKVYLVVPDSLLHHQTIAEITHEVMRALVSGLGELGHTMKPLDSYRSEFYMSFGKVASVRKMELPGAFRKIEKLYGASNALLPFIDDWIAAKFSNGHSAARMSINPIVCYIRSAI